MHRFHSFMIELLGSKSLVQQLLIICVFFTSGLACFIQIVLLTQDYLRYDVIEYAFLDSSDFTNPPNFSFCFNIRNVINTTLLAMNKPYFFKEIEKLRRKDPSAMYISNWDYVQTTFAGRSFFYKNLTLGEAFQNVVKLEELIIRCHYLSSTFNHSECDASYFEPFIYNNDMCYSFKWTDSGSQDFPRYPLSYFRAPGFTPLRLLDLSLNLSIVPFVGLVAVYVHDLKVDRLIDESKMVPLFMQNNSVQFYELFYTKKTKIHLPYPYKSLCMPKEKLPNGYASIQDCNFDCIVENYAESDGTYPRFAIIRKFDSKKMSVDYTGTKIKDFVFELIHKCTTVCGTLDCNEVSYTPHLLNRPRSNNIRGKYFHCRFMPPPVENYHMIEAPKIPLSQYFASVGSVLGIWFGFSVYSLHVLLQGNTKSLLKTTRVQNISKKTPIRQFRSKIQPRIYLLYYEYPLMKKVDRRKEIIEEREKF